MPNPAAEMQSRGSVADERALHEDVMASNLTMLAVLRP